MKNGARHVTDLSSEPGGIEFDSRSNSLLVTNKGTHAEDGEQLQIRLPKGK